MKRLFLILFTFTFFTLNAQDWTIPKVSNDWEIEKTYVLNKKRMHVLLISEFTTYTIALVALNKLWYADYPKSNFHFINDNGEWLQMDKIGHLTSSYHIGLAGIKAYKWTGMSRDNAIWYGGMTGSVFLTIIEILDGYSAEWGASLGDLVANTAGSFFAIGQELKWKEQRIQLKYSYTHSKWAKFNSEQLGDTHLERALKDYNGQTYWLSFNMKSLLNIEKDNFPAWLNLAIGYSGDNMTTPYHEKGSSQRTRQYLFSLDVDLTRINTKSKILNSILHSFSFLKFPMPALELSNRIFSEHLIYY